MIEVFDRDRRKLAILQNAFDVIETFTLNGIGSLSFSLPDTDEKNVYCTAFHLVSWAGGPLYRILVGRRLVQETGSYQYQAEHVLATLIDDVIFGARVVGNIEYPTERVLEWALNQQRVKHWLPGACDFHYQFEYGWTCETLLSAVFSIATPFLEAYQWVTDTSIYPWRLGLKRLDDTPRAYIRAGKNLVQLTQSTDSARLCTRLYPLGEGEGENQANISSVNGGVPYLESPPDILEKYGVISRIWIDRRYSHPESLKAAGAAMLAGLQTPYEAYTTEYAPLGESPDDTPLLGSMAQVEGAGLLRVAGLQHYRDERGRTVLTLANRAENVAGSIASMQDRQRIEMSYAQGATTFYQDHESTNAGPGTNEGAELRLYLPASMRIINYIKIEVELSAFRYPFIVNGGGGGLVGASNSAVTNYPAPQSTSAAGGASVQSSDAGGVSSQTGPAGDAYIHMASAFNVGYGTETTSDSSLSATYAPSAGEMHVHGMGHAHTYHNVQHHEHATSLTAHTHFIDVSPHAHMTHTESHTHDFWHTHDNYHQHALQDHQHALQPGFSTGPSASAYTLKVNGKTVTRPQGQSGPWDITAALAVNGQITRDAAHLIAVHPNSYAFVRLRLYVQGFIQSRGDAPV